MWRVRKRVASLLAADARTVSLAPGVHTDVAAIDELASRLARVGGTLDDCNLDHRPFRGELLSGWYDEWTWVERERLRQVCLHALESLAMRLLDSHRFAHALEAALAAVALEPLRESAHRVVIQVHLREGNSWEATRHYGQFSVLLKNELGLQPSPTFKQLLASLPVAT